jgi:hypothetical protein
MKTANLHLFSQLVEDAGFVSDGNSRRRDYLEGN